MCRLYGSAAVTAALGSCLDRLRGTGDRVVEGRQYPHACSGLRAWGFRSSGGPHACWGVGLKLKLRVLMHDPGVGETEGVHACLGSGGWLRVLVHA